MLRDAKYLIAYIAPLAVFIALYLKGVWSYSGLYVAFFFIPLLEPLLPGSARNLTPEEEAGKGAAFFFDLLLYLNLPILYGLIAYYFIVLSHGGLATYEIVGLTGSIGLIVGTIGINVGHEFGHRAARYERILAKILLLPALYLHFYIEHNRGHHRNVGTDEDPATARLGENVYAFWARSVIGGYRNAWRLERQRLERLGRSPWSFDNEMIRFQLAQAAYLAIVGWAFGWAMTGYAVAIAVVGFLLLECVNYIEHYGLRRRRLPSGRYEPVLPAHSWNSNHELGRIFLYELTRHSDHHYKASRKYQVLRHFDESPQLPYGYPTSILLALAPPLWFRMMNPRVREVREEDMAAGK